MTSKRLNFPSMGDPDPGDSSDLFIQNESGEYTPYIPDESNFEDYEWNSDFDLDDDRRKHDDTLAGELEAYSKVRELLSGGDTFHYFPDSDVLEESNKKFSLSRLQKEWGSETKRKIGYTNYFYKNFLPEELQREAEATGLASHHILIQELYKTAKHAEQLAMKQMRGDSETGTRTMRFRGMDRIMVQKLEERARDLACRAYSRAKDAIIRKHGGISHGG